MREHARFPAKSLAVIFILVVVARLAGGQSSVEHDRSFWRQIAQAHYAVPPGQSAIGLAQELSGLLASPDPELRDDLAYSILDAWIRAPKVFSQSELVALASAWQASLVRGIGESGTNSVLQRSFSALCLASLAARDRETPFLADSQFHALLDAATTYLNAERDLRGFDANLGWIHATAHTADLLAELAANPRLTRDEQARILTAIARRLQTAPQVYTQGEQGRLAVAVLAIMKRTDFDAPAFETWLNGLQEADRGLWDLHPLPPEALAHYQNRTYMLEALIARMMLTPTPPSLTPSRDHLLQALQGRG
jgi:hypothetical protein